MTTPGNNRSHVALITLNNTVARSKEIVTQIFLNMTMLVLGLNKKALIEKVI